jgi:hypothetical protein
MSLILACPSGFYKDITSNEIKCSPCPTNSWSSKPGATQCDCLSDFYRENESTLSQGCKGWKLVFFKKS